jgi:GNAT superfamily N-acetyltransferase
VSDRQRAIEVEAVAAQVVRPLRMAVLRPHEPPDGPFLPRDLDDETLHVAARTAGNKEVLAVGSVMRDPYPPDPQHQDWRVRGMATRPDMRGHGLGAQVLARLEQQAREKQGTRLWCNARIGARTFYERAGFAVEGDMFEIEGIGPHLLMSKRLC